jgi:hypothetical protein
MAGVLLASLIVFTSCEQTTGPENQQGAEQPAAEQPAAEGGATYVGATEDGTPVELVITGADGASHDPASGYTPKAGDTYVVKVGGEEAGRGTVTDAADGAWTLQPEGDGEPFTAKADEDGLTIKGPITDEISGEDLHELYPVEAAPPPDAEADYRISLNAPALHVFPAKAEGYAKADVKALSVIVTNTGDQPTGALTIDVPNAVPSEGFTLSKKTITSIAAGKKAAFTVKPNTGLEAGIYTAKVTVSGGNGISASFYVRFTVNNEDGSPPKGDEEDPLLRHSLEPDGDPFLRRGNAAYLHSASRANRNRHQQRQPADGGFDGRS